MVSLITRARFIPADSLVFTAAGQSAVIIGLRGCDLWRLRGVEYHRGLVGAGNVDRLGDCQADHDARDMQEARAVAWFAL